MLYRFVWTDTVSVEIDRVASFLYFNLIDILTNMTKLSICVAQTSPRSGSQRVPSDDVFAVLESNLKVTAEVVKQASAGGADIVVFPEYWLQGLVQDREVGPCFPEMLLEEG